jgi:hypothetical protein
MVTSIVPGASGVGARGVDARYRRPTPQHEAAAGDCAGLTGAAITAAHDSVRDGLMQVHQALALGHGAQAMLVEVQALAREGALAQADLNALIAGYASRVDAALAQGARVAAGEDIAVQAEPNAAPVRIAGVDLRLGGAISVPLAIGADSGAALAQAAERSLEALREAMTRLLDSARASSARRPAPPACAMSSTPTAHVCLRCRCARASKAQARSPMSSRRQCCRCFDRRQNRQSAIGNRRSEEFITARGFARPSTRPDCRLPIAYCP